MVAVLVHAFRVQDHFALGFGLTGCFCLIVCPGFAVETPTALSGWDIRKSAVSIVNLGRSFPEYDRKLPLQTHAHYHDLYTSG